jgi:hypothetical protein
MFPKTFQLLYYILKFDINWYLSMENFPLFTPDDFTLLSRAAVMAGATVAISRYSGKSGTKNEFQAIVSGLESAALQYPDNPLVQALLTVEARLDIDGLARQFKNDVRQTTYQDYKMAALNRCAQAVELLDAKASGQPGLQVRQAILEMCRQVAAASKEGGWMSSQAVDVREEGAIEEIARVLRLELA